MKKQTTLIILSLFLASCSALTGEEIARLEINKVSTQGNFFAREATLDLKKGDELFFWSDMDIAYEGDVILLFKVKIFKNQTEVAQFEFNPTKKTITTGEVKTSITGKTKWSFSGKNHEYTIEEDASYRISSILVASKNPSLKVKKAELVIKK